MLSILHLHLWSICTVWGDYPPPTMSTSCRCVPGRPQRSNQWVMCPDYNQLPMGHLQRTLEEMERGSTITLHGVITSLDSLVSSPFLWRVRLKDKLVNNSASPVSAVGSYPNNHWLVVHAIQNYTNLHSRTYKNMYFSTIGERMKWEQHQMLKIERRFNIWCSWVHVWLSQENKLSV